VKTDKYCIKCLSSETLSIKYYTRAGKEPRYYCNQCRTEERLRNKPKSRKKTNELPFEERWKLMAKESQERLLKRAVKITRV
jgi:transposase-like protein